MSVLNGEVEEDKHEFRTFVDAPQPRVGIEIAHVHGGVHLYDVPIVGAERSRQKDEAESPADASCGHHQAQMYLHPAHGGSLGLSCRFGVNVRMRRHEQKHPTARV